MLSECEQGRSISQFRFRVCCFFELRKYNVRANNSTVHYKTTGYIPQLCVLITAHSNEMKWRVKRNSILHPSCQQIFPFAVCHEETSLCRRLNPYSIYLEWNQFRATSSLKASVLPTQLLTCIKWYVMKYIRLRKKYQRLTLLMDLKIKIWRRPCNFANLPWYSQPAASVLVLLHTFKNVSILLGKIGKYEAMREWNKEWKQLLW